VQEKFILHDHNQRLLNVRFPHHANSRLKSLNKRRGRDGVPKAVQVRRFARSTRHSAGGRQSPLMELSLTYDMAGSAEPM
jgi:hypothetical protein